MTDLAEREIDFTEESGMVLRVANEVSITNQEQYDLTEDFLKTTKTLIKGIKDFFEPMRKAADEAKKAILTRKNDALDPVEEADTIVRRKRQAFRDAQEKIRREAQRKEEERATREAEAERKRILERASKAKKPETVERLEEKAEEVYANPVFVESAIETGSVRKELEVTVINEEAFFEAMLKGIVSTYCADINKSKLKSWIKSTGKKQGEVPGVSIKWTTKDVVRG